MFLCCELCDEHDLASIKSRLIFTWLNLSCCSKNHCTVSVSKWYIVCGASLILDSQITLINIGIITGVCHSFVYCSFASLVFWLVLHHAPTSLASRSVTRFSTWEGLFLLFKQTEGKFCTISVNLLMWMHECSLVRVVMGQGVLSKGRLCWVCFVFFCWTVKDAQMLTGEVFWKFDVNLRPRVSLSGTSSSEDVRMLTVMPSGYRPGLNLIGMEGFMYSHLFSLPLFSQTCKEIMMAFKWVASW